MGIFSKVKKGLDKTRTRITDMVDAGAELDDDFYESLEDALVGADINIDQASVIVEDLRADVARNPVQSPGEAYERMKKDIVQRLDVRTTPDDFPPKPWVMLVVGVNGVGKTTTIAKLAHEAIARGKKVMLGAADTFRAGAIEQLQLWAERTGADIVAQQAGADAGAVAYNTLDAAGSRGSDLVLLDTAGRLHNKAYLMEELKKIYRVCRRKSSHMPNDVLLVVDATTGQNAVQQAKLFNEALPLTGFIVTKLDGTAKGGVAVSLATRMDIPVRKIGLGEAMDDLQDFDPQQYVDAMFGSLP
jgi:fused signal recognition particle receptor